MPKPTRTRRAAEAIAVALRGGAGKHGDRRLKRQKTRAAQLKAALKE